MYVIIKKRKINFMKNYKCVLLNDINFDRKKLLTKITGIFLATTLLLNPSISMAKDINFENPETIKNVVLKRENNIYNYSDFVKNKKSGIHNTEFGDIAFYFNDVNKQDFIDELLSKYNISDDSNVKHAFTRMSSKNQPEIFFMKIRYFEEGEEKILKLIKFETGSDFGDEIDIENKKNFESFKKRYRSFKMLHENFEEFVLLHEIFHAPEFIWKERTSVQEFFSDISSVMTIGIEKNLNYNEVIKMANEIRRKRERDLSIYNSHDHYNSDLYSYDVFKKILPSEKDFYKLKLEYESEKNKNKHLSVIADFLTEQINSHSKIKINKLTKNNNLI